MMDTALLMRHDFKGNYVNSIVLQKVLARKRQNLKFKAENDSPSSVSCDCHGKQIQQKSNSFSEECVGHACANSSLQ